jgi:parallel beta-helix repeat protein
MFIIVCENRKDVIKLKKTVTILFMILGLLSVSYLTGYKMYVKAQTNVLYVNLTNILGPWDGTSAHPYENITSGLENALSGDTIFVSNGTYSEHLVVNESVSLVGEGVDSTIIDGTGSGTIINVTANNVNIQGFTLKSSGTSSGDSAIHLMSTNGSVISNNKMTESYTGVFLESSVGNVISGNIISDNSYYGINFLHSGNNVVSGNRITNNFYGIRFFFFSMDNVVSGNNIYSNACGISLDSSSSGNTFYHNNFSNTIQQVMSDSANSWDYGGEGNYWSDYRGRDLNGDGIGDDPYVINAVSGNIDNYPLMGTFSDFSVNLQREAYDVAVVSNSTISDFGFEIEPETGNKMICFNVTGEDGTVGFCRVAIPTGLMNYSFVVLVDEEQITPTFLNVSSETYRYLYFTYIHSSHTITIVSSQTLYLYNELLDEYNRLLMNLHNLNATYYELLYNYSILLENYTLLQESHSELNASYQEHLLVYSENMRNIQNLTYVFAATTAVFLIVTIYLSKRTHGSIPTKTKLDEEE